MIFLPFEKMDENLFEEHSEIQILKIVHSYNRPTWFFKSHSHPDQTEILYIAGGKGIYTADNVPHHAMAGDIIIFNSDVVHSVESDYQDPLDVWSCAVRGFQIKGMPPNDILPTGINPVFHTGVKRLFFQEIYTQIYQQRQEQSQGYYSICTSLATLLILFSCQLVDEQRKNNIKENNTFATKIILYLDEHFHEPITMDTLCQTFHLSASHISHAVSNEFHISPINYLIDRRIREAQWELVSTSYTIKDIADHVGYDNTNYFCNLFFRRTGMKPSEFRQFYTK